MGYTDILYRQSVHMEWPKTAKLELSGKKRPAKTITSQAHHPPRSQVEVFINSMFLRRFKVHFGFSFGPSALDSGQHHFSTTSATQLGMDIEHGPSNQPFCHKSYMQKVWYIGTVYPIYSYMIYLLVKI